MKWSKFLILETSCAALSMMTFKTAVTELWRDILAKGCSSLTNHGEWKSKAPSTHENLCLSLEAN